MKVLVVGGGGREHALVWKIAQDRARPEIFCAPGNAGTAQLATNVDLRAEDVEGIVRWARANRPDLVVIGPEAPLCLGLTDRLEAEGFAVFGPDAGCARLEGSKAFAKEVMQAGGVPTAAYGRFTSADEAIAYVERVGGRLVVKADGLAAGKGVIVCDTPAEAVEAVRRLMIAGEVGVAGGTLVIEERLEGEEASILALVDGENVVLLPSAQDHKRVFDNDQGPNTGGMGAYSPAPVVTDALLPAIREQVFGRTLTELRRRGLRYRGVLYAGLMLTAEGPRVLEFNCRFGDPETQAVLPRLAVDLVPLMQACIRGELRADMVVCRPEPSVCVVLAAGGYPGAYTSGKVIRGLGDAAALNDVVVFHAGTRRAGADVVTSGGRVLGVTALGATVPDAIRRAYEAVGRIAFEGVQYRRDIGARALARLA